MYNPHEAIKENPLLIDDVIRAQCVDSVLFQTRYFFRVNQGQKFVVGDHHKLINDVLERVFKGELTRVIINLPPRYSKTELAVKNFIAKGLALNAAAKFIHVSYSKSLALDNSESVKDLIQSEEYQRLFPNVKLKKDSKAKEKWYTTVGGGVYATSSGGQITGFGAGKVDSDEDEASVRESIDEFTASSEVVADEIEAKFRFAGAIIIDDPNKTDDTGSKVKLKAVSDRFDNTISSRTNSRRTPIIVIQQRVDANDLTGYLLSRESADDWYVLRLPAIQEYTDEYGEKRQKALWEHKHTLEELLKMEKDNPTVFARQYQQRDEAEQGLLFPLSELKFYNPSEYDPMKESELRAGYVDPSDTGGDYLSAPFSSLVGGRIYLHDVIYNTDGTDRNGDRIANTSVQLKLNNLLVEGNGGWKMFGKDLRKKINIDLKSPNTEVRVFSNTKNKHIRILEASGAIKNHCVFRSDWREIPEYRKFMECLTSYQIVQESANPEDDAPDSLGGLVNFYRSRGLL
jgi:predicted phage terminase large subunit-like protein|nr:MAG TPA: Large Terminase [Caudoviricetes sp.]